MRCATMGLLAALLLPLSPAPAAETPGRVEQEAFAYESPAGWTVFKDEKLSNFSLLGFFNAEGEVMQLSVSGKLTTEQYTGARSRLQAVDRQPERQGWRLAAATIVELPPFGSVSESVHYDNAYSLTSYSYSVFGPERIALITITFKGIKPEAVAAARRLVGGLRWK